MVLRAPVDGGVVLAGSGRAHAVVFGHVDEACLHLCQARLAVKLYLDLGAVHGLLRVVPARPGPYRRTRAHADLARGPATRQISCMLVQGSHLMGPSSLMYPSTKPQESLMGLTETALAGLAPDVDWACSASFWDGLLLVWPREPAKWSPGRART